MLVGGEKDAMGKFAFRSRTGRVQGTREVIKAKAKREVRGCEFIYEKARTICQKDVPPFEQSTSEEKLLVRKVLQVFLSEREGLRG